ncbi:MAG: hypothetical protein V4448_17550 [Pseudomonadota bacterium]
MKTFIFDEAGNMTVTEKTVGKNDAGEVVDYFTQHDIQASQVERHFPMFKASMSTAEKAEAAAIIAEQNAE